ncbi:MAG: hypothetical protein ACI9R3_001473 [Verrucomicrobiales bacterium]|jgi:hypothetical protein
MSIKRLNYLSKFKRLIDKKSILNSTQERSRVRTPILTAAGSTGHVVGVSSWHWSSRGVFDNIAQTVNSPEEVDAELQYLMGTFSD